MYKAIIVFAVTLIVTGCFPVKYRHSTTIEGNVIDSNTRAPVANALIYFKDFPDSSTTSDDNGKFKLPEDEEFWGYTSLLGAYDRVSPHGNLIVKAEGYVVLEIQANKIGHSIVRAELNKKN